MGIDGGDFMLQPTYNAQTAYSMIIVAILSSIGSILVIFLYIFYKKLRSFALLLIVYLCIADLISNFSLFIQLPYKQNYDIFNWLCQLQASLVVFSDLSVVIWSCIISYSIYITVVNSTSKEQLAKKHNIFFFLGFVLPFLLCTIPMFLNQYDPNVYYCWISQQQQTVNLLLMILFRYGILWGGIIYILTTILLVLQSIWNSEETVDSSVVQRMLYYPLILIICGIFPTVERIMELQGVETGLTLITYLSFTTSRLQGLLNAMIYGFTPAIRKAIFSQKKNIDSFEVRSDNSVDQFKYSEGKLLSDDNLLEFRTSF